MRISRKEAKEPAYWLELLENENHALNKELKTEAEELLKIFSAIINKLTAN